MIRRGLVLAAIALALVLASAAPASAAPSYRAVFTGKTVRVETCTYVRKSPAWFPGPKHKTYAATPTVGNTKRLCMSRWTQSQYGFRGYVKKPVSWNWHYAKEFRMVKI